MIEDTVGVIFSQAAPRKGGSVFNNWSWNQLELWIFLPRMKKGFLLTAGIYAPPHSFMLKMQVILLWGYIMANFLL